MGFNHSLIGNHKDASFQGEVSKFFKMLGFLFRWNIVYCWHLVVPDLGSRFGFQVDVSLGPRT